MARRRKSRRSRGRQKASAWVWLAWCGLVAVVAGIVGFVIFGASETLDSNLCPESGATSETVLLVDASSPLSEKHRSELGRILREMGTPASQMHVPPGGRVTAYHLPDIDALDADAIPAVATVCNPGSRPEDRSWIDDLTQGQLIALGTWRQFEQELASMFPEKTDETHVGSPILETIAIIVPRHAESSRSDQDRHLHLVIWSDMLENSAGLSQYRPYPDPEQFINDAEYRYLHVDLRGVDVSLFRLERPGHGDVQDAAHYHWWREVFEAMGARVRWHESI